MSAVCLSIFFYLFMICMPGLTTVAQVTGMHKTEMTSPLSSDAMAIPAKQLGTSHMITRLTV